MDTIYLNQRIYHKRADMFGRVVSIEPDVAHIKYEWPYDAAGDPVPVPVSELQVPVEGSWPWRYINEGD